VFLPPVIYQARYPMSTALQRSARLPHEALRA